MRHRVLPDLMFPTASPPSAGRPSIRRRRRTSRRLDVVTLTALRDLVAPPADDEAESARVLSAVMARIHAANAAGARDG